MSTISFVKPDKSVNHIGFRSRNTNMSKSHNPVNSYTLMCVDHSQSNLKGKRFFVTFKVDMSNFRHVYFLKHKSDVLECFKEYERMIGNKCGCPMKVLRSNNGRTYCNSVMKQSLASRRIRMENTAPYTPEQNER